MVSGAEPETAPDVTLMLATPATVTAVVLIVKVAAFRPARTTTVAGGIASGLSLEMVNV